MFRISPARSITAALCLLLVACVATPATLATPIPPTVTVAPSPPPPIGLRVVCNVPKDWCDAIRTTFQTRTGIVVDTVQRSTGETLENLRGAQGQPEFDVWYGGPADSLITAKSEGLLYPYRSTNAIRILATLKDPDNYWVGVYMGILGFCVNRDLLARKNIQAPRSWEALLDEQYKGLLTLPHPATSATGLTMVGTQMTLAKDDLDLAFDYFRKIKDNVVIYGRSDSDPANIVSEGQAAVGVVFAQHCVRGQMDGHSELEIVYPAEGSPYEVGGVAIVNHTPHVEAAKAFMDWVVAKEGQETPYKAHWYLLPTNPNAVVPGQLTTGAKRIDYDALRVATLRNTIVERFNTEIAPLTAQP